MATTPTSTVRITAVARLLRATTSQPASSTNTATTRHQRSRGGDTRAVTPSGPMTTRLSPTSPDTTASSVTAANTRSTTGTPTHSSPTVNGRPWNSSRARPGSTAAYRTTPRTPPSSACPDGLGERHHDDLAGGRPGQPQRRQPLVASGRREPSRQPAEREHRDHHDRAGDPRQGDVVLGAVRPGDIRPRTEPRQATRADQQRRCRDGEGHQREHRGDVALPPDAPAQRPPDPQRPRHRADSTRPSRIRTTRPHHCATSTSWVTTTSDDPDCRVTPVRCRMTSADVPWSSAPVGSSANTTPGDGDHRPGDRHPLRLAAGQLPGPSPLEPLEPQDREQRRRLGHRGGPRPSRQHQRHRDVLDGRQLRQQVARLEHEPEVLAPQRAALPVGHPRQVAAAPRHRAAASP